MGQQSESSFNGFYGDVISILRTFWPKGQYDTTINGQMGYKLLDLGGSKTSNTLKKLTNGLRSKYLTK